jgi:hypothetical protein
VSGDRTNYRRPRGLESKYENGRAWLTIILSREEVFDDLAKSLAGLLGR